MPWDNRLNPAKGRRFQKIAALLLSNHFGVDFETDVPIPIGNPPKQHKFDLVSSDRKFIGECKSYSWTESGNVPSAKMGFVNEAIFYLTFLPPKINRFVAMRKDVHRKRRETLSEYYYRMNKHLLGNIYILEIDVEESLIRGIGK